MRSAPTLVRRSGSASTSRSGSRSATCRWPSSPNERKDGIVARGQALIAPLVGALGRLGATLVVDCPGERLLTEDGRISGRARGGP